MQQYIKQTQNLYEIILNEVIEKLKQNSDQGQLQMSESEIQTFKDFWLSSLNAIQGGQEVNLKTKVSPQLKQNRDNPIEEEPAILKKIKTNLDTSIIKKEESDLLFSDDSEDEINPKVEQDTYEKALKYLDYQIRKNEFLRKKTLFDKIRELDQLKSFVEVEDEDDDDDDDKTEEPRVFDTQVYAQKLNKDNLVCRIKPNKSQKISLEYVLIKEKSNQEVIYPYAQLVFNFKTYKKISSN
ncbi:unnamed protein product [Paramecium sonneborni]|uniref:Uncharacterized protein n=1 Tax=Paramecium sonneborni TaxID=65129 RepID=A0A8S1RQJ1_9CILI|nr:unnamed protein product [Paramecium sonneborni]